MVKFHKNWSKSCPKKLCGFISNFFSFFFVNNHNTHMVCNFTLCIKRKYVACSKVCNSLINVLIEHVLGALNVACYKTNAYTSV